MFKSFKRIFHRRKELEVDLGNFTIRDLVNFPYKEGAKINVPFIDEVIHDNHLIVRQTSSRTINAIHHYEYLPEEKVVIVESYFERDAYMTYLSVLARLHHFISGSRKYIALLFNSFFNILCGVRCPIYTHDNRRSRNATRVGD